MQNQRKTLKKWLRPINELGFTKRERDSTVGLYDFSEGYKGNLQNNRWTELGFRTRLSSFH